MDALTHPLPSFGGQTITVSLSSEKTKIIDPTVRLVAGDHPYVKEPTFVAYYYAKLRSLAGCDGAIAAGLLRLERRFSPGWVRKFQDGLMESPDTPEKIQTCYTVAVSEDLHR